MVLFALPFATARPSFEIRYFFAVLEKPWP